jgi:hypothetical protein
MDAKTPARKLTPEEVKTITFLIPFTPKVLQNGRRLALPYIPDEDE